MSANALQEFFVSLGFEVDTSKINEFEQQTARLREGMLKVSAVATGIAAGVGIFVAKAAESLDDLGDFADLNELSAAAVQQFGQAAQMNGASLEAAKSSIAGMNKVIGEAALGLGRGAMTFEKLGMSAKNADGSVKTFDQMVGEIADKMDGISRQEQIAMAEKLGIDASLVPMLSKGAEALREYMDAAKEFSLTDAEFATAGKFQDTMDQLKFAMRGLRDQIAVRLMPVVREAMEGFYRWLRVNREIIKERVGQAIELVSTAVGYLWVWVKRAAGSLERLYDWVTRNKGAMAALGLAVGAIVSYQLGAWLSGVASAIKLAAAAAAGINPMLAVLGAVAILVALLIDDLATWQEGGESVIGDMMEAFPGLVAVFEGIGQAVGALVDFWLAQWNTLKGPLGDLGGALWRLISVLADLLWPVVKMIFAGWGHIMAAVIPVVASLVGWIAEALVGAIATVIEAGAWLANVFTVAFTGIQEGISFVVGLFDAAREKVVGFIDMVAGAIGKVGQLLGLTSGNSSVSVAVGSGSVPAASSSAVASPLAAGGGIIGSAASSSLSNTTNSQMVNIGAPNITINSPDAAKAGEAVREALDRMARTAVRNGQSAVAL